MSAAVIPIPNAAPKKVRQAWSRTTKAQREALLRFPDIHMTPAERAAERSAAIIGELEMTPAFAMAVAMFQTLDELQKLKVQGLLACMGARDSVKQAIEYCHFATAQTYQQRLINEALRRQRGEVE